MKNAKMSAIVGVLVLLILAGCDYLVPLTEEHTLAIDPSILGLWEEVPEGNAPPDPQGRMLILKYSDTEYLVHYPTGKDGVYFRAYPIKIGGISCVQLQTIGKANGETEDRKFNVATYVMSKGKVEIKILNSDVIDRDIRDSAELREAFLKNRNNKDLFANPGSFRKVRVKG